MYVCSFYKKRQKKKIDLNNLLIMMMFALFAQTNPVKNIILLIPDGTSTSVLAAARWYQIQQDPSRQNLYIDPFVRGLIRTHSSDAPIGDSAPTTSCYVTGYPTQTGFISTYPQKTDHDLVPVDATRAYQPLTTLLEAAKLTQDKATGLVVTCHFPHATPADCAAHSYNRNLYNMIAKQMVYNDLDVVIGGGTKYLKEPEQEYLKSKGYHVLLDDYAGMQQCSSAPMWALFNEESMSYDLERDPKSTPSLAEMTEKAINLLSADPDGFFLMVEGSKVDWAAHNNDGIAVITDFLAFDKACGVALDFARKSGNTLVVIVPDHGNSGMTIGSSAVSSGYDKLSLEQLMGPLQDYKLSTSTMADKMKAVETTEWPVLFKQYFNIELQDSEILFMQSASDYGKSSLPKEQRKNNLSLDKMISKVVYGRTCLGFTTFGHTGENVFYAMYHPNSQEMSGIRTNVELNHYMCEQLGLPEGELDRLTAENFVDHRQVFADYSYQIDSVAPEKYILTVKNRKTTLTVESGTNFVTVNKRKFDLGTIVLYFPINKTFNLPKNLDMYMNLK